MKGGSSKGGKDQESWKGKEGLIKPEELS